MRKISVLMASLGLFAAAGATAAESAAVSKGGLEIRFGEKTRTLAISDREAGPILERGVVHVTIGDAKISSDDKSLKYRTVADSERGELAVEFPEKFTLKARVADDGELEIRAEGKQVRQAAFESHAAAPHAMIAMLQDEHKDDQGVLVTTLGPAVVGRARSLFDPDHDLAVTLGSAGKAIWATDNGWNVRAETPAGAPLLSLKVRRHYYRDDLKIQYYAPITKRARWQTAPVVAMTWYGIEGWKGNPAQTKEWLYPNVDWVAKHLLPYAETLVFQLDDNYAKNDDKYMRDISDYIRSKGLIPGIWFTPYTVAPKEVSDQHPDWFIHGKDGKTIGTFGGVSYKGNQTLNATNADAVKAWFGMWWRKASETWNFDFFKIDGQPNVIDAYKRATDGGNVEGYRKGLATGREIVGPEKFINGCWGIPLDAIGPLDGSRTGPDTGNQAHAIDVILHWNFLNNVCWWSDPDAAANLYKATVERTRLNAQARVLTGQQFLTDDMWTSVPEAIRRVWQLSYPMLDIKPVNLYPIDPKEYKRYDLFDLRIAKPWGTWDVVGLFNYDGRPAVKTLDLARLPLESGEVHVYEYWKGVYLGRFPRDAKIQRVLDPYEGEVFSITAVPEDDHPVLISTNRHLTQGGLDVEKLEYAKSGLEVLMVQGPARWFDTIGGRSSHLIAGDPYEMVFAAGRYRVATTTRRVGRALSLGQDQVTSGGGVWRVRIIPDRSGPVEWTVAFEASTEPRLDVTPEVCIVRPGTMAELTIFNFGPRGFTWEARASDSRIRVSPSEGDVAAWPRVAKATISADASGLEPGKTWSGIVTVTAQGAEGSPRKVAVSLRVPPPANLAREAKAKASSFWGRGFEADKVNDGDTATRWNAGKAEKQGCWIELDWDKPATFDSVVIDEVMEFNGRIEAWKLEAGGDALEEIARGANMGLRRTINLKKSVEATRLRLTIEKAVETPTIREIEVYRIRKER